MLPMPSHSTVESEAIISSDGFVVSSIVNVAVVELALPQSSVAGTSLGRSHRTAVVAQGIVVVAPGHAAANVRSCSSAVVGEPVVQLIMLPMPSHSTVESTPSPKQEQSYPQS